MKLTAFLLTVAFLQVHAKGISQVTLSLKKTPVEKVFREIERQTGYGFLYTKEMLADLPQITINVKNASVKEVLNQCFKGQSLEYSIDKNTIVITRKVFAAANTLVPDLIASLPPPIEIHGRVVNQQGQPLQNVSVLISGTKIGTTTNSDGRFTINAPNDKNIVLEISSVGYQTKKVKFAGQTEMNVTLELEVTGLSDVVVVGYGTERKKDITGSIASVSAKDLDLKNVPVATLGQSLQGKISGVRISQTTGRPGDGLKFQIRGAVSLTAGADPLYVVDGMPISGDISFMDPGEIESITVLKDAAASALYGSRASNGVILVDTKTGATGKTRINFNAYGGFESIPENRHPKVMNAREYAQFENDIAVTNGRPVDPLFANPDQYGKGTNWFDVVTRKGAIQSYNMTLSAGTDKFKVSSTAGYFNQEGVVVGSGFKRYSLRVNTRYQATDKLAFGFNVAPTYQYNTNLPTDGNPYGSLNIISGALITSPLTKPYNPDGSLALTASDPAGFGNPNWLRVAKEEVHQQKDISILTNGYVEYELIEGLIAKSTINFQIDNTDMFQFNPSTIGTLFSPPPRIPSGADNTTRFINMVNENTITYKKNIGDKQSFEVLAGFTNQRYRRDGEYLTGTNYPDDKVQVVSAAGTISVNSDIQEWSLISYLGRLSYQYNNKYLFSASIRRDGSSRFGQNNRYGNFPAVSAGWIISKEKFWNVKPISFLKVRASYGVTGNFDIGNYSAIASVGPTYYTFGSSVAAGRAISNLSDENLGWENNKESDFGLDLAFFAGRIQLTYDFYNRYTSDLLYNVQVPASSGFNNIQTNVGKLQFWGNEVSLKASIIRTSKMAWNTNFNISFDRNKTLALSTQSNKIDAGFTNYGIPSNITEVGHPVSMFYGAVSLGVYKDQHDFDNSPHAPTSAVGTAKFKDINGDGKISFPEDLTIIGSPWPKYSFGMSNTLQYGNFDFTVVVAGTVGNKILPYYENWLANLDGVFNVLEDLNNRWKSPSDPGNGQWGSVQQGTTSMERDTWNSRYLKDGSYLSVKNLTLGYTVSKGATPKFFKDARIFLSAQNVFIFTKYPGGNPEVNTSNSPSGSSPGMDSNVYPLPITMTAGVNLSF